MSRKATLEIDGKKYEFPLIEGTENELAIDVKTLRGITHPSRGRRLFVYRDAQTGRWKIEYNIH